MDETTTFPSNGEDTTDEATETTSATAGTDAGSKDTTDIELYTIVEVQAMLRLTREGAYQWVRKHIRPFGGTVRIGRRVLIHKWALNAALKQKTWKPEHYDNQRKALTRSRYILSQKRKLAKTTPE